MNPRHTLRLLLSRPTTRIIPAPLKPLLPQTPSLQTRSFTTVPYRLNTTTPESQSHSQPPTKSGEEAGGAEAEPERPPRPAYDITFTCRRCSTRSTHNISKQAYHFGTLLISCPGCLNRHVITDHLCIFNEKAKTLEDMLAERGEILKKAVLTPDGVTELLPEALEERGSQITGRGEAEAEGAAGAKTQTQSQSQSQPEVAKEGVKNSSS
ncbi:hypothetical protein RUND412_006710 [Rhizina undulata]